MFVMKINAILNTCIHLKHRELFATEKYIEKKFKEKIFCYKCTEEVLFELLTQVNEAERNRSKKKQRGIGVESWK